MKFGIFDHVEQRRDVPLDRQYSDRIELLMQADRGGIYGYHVAEHHHSPLSMAPCHAPYFTAIAAKTEHIRFGPLVYVLPLYHPVRLLEEICMVDNLSGGRYQIGVGRGAPVGEEFAMWGGEPDETHERFEEVLQILMQGLTQEFLTFEGKHYQYQDLWMALKPKQQPYPPFWYAGNPIHAGAYGANLISAGPTSQLPKLVAMYQEARQKQMATDHQPLLYGQDPLYGAVKRVFIAETDDEALRRARPAYEAYRANFTKPLPGRRSRRPTPAGSAERNREFPWDATFDEARKGEGVLVGSPETVRDYVVHYVAESGCNYFVSSFQWGDVTHEEASRSLRLFVSEVMPHVADASPV